MRFADFLFDQSASAVIAGEMAQRKRNLIRDIGEAAGELEPADEPEDDSEDFWDSYTAWRDEELSRTPVRSGASKRP